MAEKKYIINNDSETILFTLNNPNLHLEYSMDEIYALQNEISSEIFPENIKKHESLDFVSLLPPLYYDDKFIKGAAFTQAPDLIHTAYPHLKSLFHIISEPMYLNFPHQDTGDAVFSLYKNDEREQWFRKNYPHRTHEICIPLEDTDFVHEYVMTPREGKKEYDIIMVARINYEKNLPLIAQALKCYREKYKKDLKVLWVIGKEFDESLNGLNDSEKSIIKEMSQFFENSYKYVDIVQKVNYNDMPKEYSKAKICLLASLIEGKNRSIREAMACNVPILLFNDYLKYVRADNDIIPNFEGNAGHKVKEFSAEALADGIEYMLKNIDTFSARKTFLRTQGRKNFFNTVLDSFPYYKENIPNYEEGSAFNNFWLDLAISNNYMLSLNDFLYSRNLRLQSARGIESFKKLMDFYSKRFEKFL